MDLTYCHHQVSVLTSLFFQVLSEYEFMLYNSELLNAGSNVKATWVEIEIFLEKEEGLFFKVHNYVCCKTKSHDLFRCRYDILILSCLVGYIVGNNILWWFSSSSTGGLEILHFAV